MILNRKYAFLFIDLFWVAVSPFVALLIRDHFSPPAGAFPAAVVYCGLSLVIGAVVFPLAGLNRTLWRYTSLGEFVRLQLAVTATVLLALLATFAHTRLLDISRSLPLIQWFVLVAAMTGTRLAVRVYRERTDVGAEHQFVREESTKHVLIVGVNRLTEVYLRALADLVPHDFSVVGLLAKGTRMNGRLLRSYKVLGEPEDLPKIMQELEVHGTWLDRVIVTKDLKQLSPIAQQALLELERASNVKVVWLPEILGFGSTEVAVKTRALENAVVPPAPRRRYRYPKRLLDVTVAFALLVSTAPLLALTALLIALDVGLPVVFWQNRPGLFGRHFRLYKFRTMRAPHDELGNRIPDEDRVTKLGSLIRLCRLDELPQLYNVLVGEMSLVGPRPLIATDHEPGTRQRLAVRPGLTGWAQVNGGRKLPCEDKAALDIWYVAHRSLALDLKIALRTFLLLFTGECINGEAVRAAHEARLRGSRVVPHDHSHKTKIRAAARSAA